jgi:hypothetical protein
MLGQLGRIERVLGFVRQLGLLGKLGRPTPLASPRVERLLGFEWRIERLLGIQRWFERLLGLERRIQRWIERRRLLGIERRFERWRDRHPAPELSGPEPAGCSSSPGRRQCPDARND